jgi:hypothetical protein
MEKTIQWPKKKDVIERLNNESTIGISTTYDLPRHPLYHVLNLVYQKEHVL